MDLKILVVVLPIIVFISIEASPIGGGGSGGKIGIRQSEGFQGGNNKSIKVKGFYKFFQLFIVDPISCIFLPIPVGIS